MTSQQLVSIAVNAGYEVTEYEGHYCVRANISLVVTVPKVARLVPQLVKKIRAALGL